MAWTQATDGAEVGTFAPTMSGIFGYELVSDRAAGIAGHLVGSHADTCSRIPQGASSYPGSIPIILRRND